MSSGSGNLPPIRFWDTRLSLDIEKFRRVYQQAAQDPAPQESGTQGIIRSCRRWLAEKLFPDHKFFFNKQITMRDVQELSLVKIQAPNTKDVRSQIKAIREKILNENSCNKREPVQEGGFGEYAEVLDRIVAKETKQVKFGNFCLTLSNIIVSGLYLLTFQISHWPSLYVGSVNLLLAFWCLFQLVSEAKLVIVENQIQTKKRMALRLMIYDRLMATDSQLLSLFDNNIIYKLLYKETEDFTKFSHSTWYKLLLFDIAILSTLFRVGQEVWFAGTAYFFIAHIILIILFLACRPLVLRLKKVIINQKKLVLEILNSFKDARFLGLGQICVDRVAAFTKIQQQTMEKYLVNHAFAKILQKTYGPLVTLGQVLAFLLGTFPTSQKQYNNQMLPPTRLGFFFVWYQVEKSLEEMRWEIELQTNKVSAKRLFDKFFTTDVLIESNQVVEMPKEVGCLRLDDCEMYDRIPANFSEVVDFLLEKDKNRVLDVPVQPEREILDDKVPLSKQNSDFKLSKKSTIIKKVAPKSRSLILLPVVPEGVSVTGLFSNEKIARQETKRLVYARMRRIFSELTVDIKSGDKVCIVDDKNRDAASYLIRLIAGGGILTKGTLKRGGKCILLNPSRPCFLAGQTIKNNILFGRPYAKERYESILKQTGLNLHAYPGRDHHQLGENANNVSNKDRVLILLARALFCDADIYIIEDLFRDPEQLNLLGTIRKLFLGLLKEKTVIYNSRLLPFICCSTLLLKFTDSKHLKQMTFGEFKSTFRQKYKSDIERLTRVEAYQDKQVQNCYFLANADFREELMIEKDLQTHRALVEHVRRENSNLVEQMFAGILLVQKVIKRGKIIPDSSAKTLSSWQILKLFFIDPVTKKSRLGTYSALSLSKSVALYLHIFLNTFLVRLYNPNLPQNYFFGEDVQGPFTTTYLSEKDSGQVYFVVALTVIAYFSLSAATTWYANKITRGRIAATTSKTGAWLMSMSYKFVDSNLFHVLVEKFTSQPLMMNLEILPKYILLIDLVLEYGVIALGLFMLLSFWPNIIIQGVFIYIFMKVIYPTRVGYIKLQEIKQSYQSKLDQVHHQLLHLITEYRLSGQLDLIITKLDGLHDNLALLMTTDQLVYRKTTILIMIGMVTLMAVMIFSVRFLTRYMPSAFYIRGGDLILYMNLFMYLRQTYVLWEIITTFFAVQESTHTVSDMVDFHSKMAVDQQHLQTVGSQRLWRRTEFEPEEPLVLRHVSVTQGYRPVLKNVSFSLARGSKSAIVGTDWVGRSAIFQVIMGAYRPDASQKEKQYQTRQTQDRMLIKIFGVEQEFMSSQLYQKLLLIDRSANLLDGTVRSNMDPYSKSTDNQILEIATKFGLEEILQRLEPEEDVMILDPKDEVDEGSIMRQKSLQSESPHLFGSNLQPLPPLDLKLSKHVSVPTQTLNQRFDRAENYKELATDRETYRIGQTKVLQLKEPRIKEETPEPISRFFAYEGKTVSPILDKPEPSELRLLKAESNNAIFQSRKSSKDLDAMSVTPLKMQVLKNIEKQSAQKSVAGSNRNLAQPGFQKIAAKHPKQFSSARKIGEKSQEQQQSHQTIHMPKTKLYSHNYLGSHNELMPLDKSSAYEYSLNEDSKTEGIQKKHDLSIPEHGQLQNLKDSDQKSVSSNQADVGRNRLGSSPKPLETQTPAEREPGSKVEMGGLYLVKIARLESSVSQDQSALLLSGAKPTSKRNVNDISIKPMERTPPLDDDMNLSHLSSLFADDEPPTERSRTQGGADRLDDSGSDGPPLHSKSLRSLNNRASQDYSRGVNSRSRNSLKRGSGTAQILADLPVKNGVSSAVVRAFLDKQVGFSGNNLHPELRKLCLVVRAMLEKPELLLIYEEVLDFGHGLEKNLQLLFQLLEDTTILAITKTNSLLDKYDKILLMDAGYVLSGGTLQEQLASEDSYLHKYLQETDARALELLLSKYGLEQHYKSRRMMKRENRFTVLHKSSPSMNPLPSQGNLQSGQMSIAEHTPMMLDRNDSGQKSLGRKGERLTPSKSAAEWKDGWIKTGVFSSLLKERSMSVAVPSTSPQLDPTLGSKPAFKSRDLGFTSELERDLNFGDSPDIKAKHPQTSLVSFTKPGTVEISPKQGQHQPRNLQALQVFGSTGDGQHVTIKKFSLERQTSQEPRQEQFDKGTKISTTRYAEGIHQVKVFKFNQNDLAEISRKTSGFHGEMSARVIPDKTSNLLGGEVAPYKAGSKSAPPKKTRTITVEEEVCVIAKRKIIITEQY